MLSSYLFYYGQAKAGAFDSPGYLLPLKKSENIFRIRPFEPFAVVNNRKYVAIPPFFVQDPDLAQPLAAVF